MNIEDITTPIEPAPPVQQALIDQLIDAWKQCHADERIEEAALLEDTIRTWAHRRAHELASEMDPVLMNDFWAWLDERLPFKIARRDAR